MRNDRFERIRRRAIVIWESEGRPLDAHRRHWEQAMHEIDLQDASSAPAPRQGRKPFSETNSVLHAAVSAIGNAIGPAKQDR